MYEDFINKIFLTCLATREHILMRDEMYLEANVKVSDHDWR